MPTSGLGFGGDTFGAGGGSSDPNAGGTPFSEPLDEDGKITIAVADANLYDVSYNFQGNPGASDGLRRPTPSDTANIIIESENGPQDEGIVVAGRYWLKPS